MKKEKNNQSQTAIDFLLQSTDSKGAANMFSFMVPAGAGVPVTFYKELWHETIFGIERIITFTVEAKAMDIAPGETCFVPLNAIHLSEKIQGK